MVTGLLYWTRDINFCNSLNEFEFLKVFRLNPLNSLCLSWCPFPCFKSLVSIRCFRVLRNLFFTLLSELFLRTFLDSYLLSGDVFISFLLLLGFFFLHVEKDSEYLLSILVDVSFVLLKNLTRNFFFLFLSLVSINPSLLLKIYIYNFIWPIPLWTFVPCYTFSRPGLYV